MTTVNETLPAVGESQRSFFERVSGVYGSSWSLDPLVADVAGLTKGQHKWLAEVNEAFESLEGGQITALLDTPEKKERFLRIFFPLFFEDDILGIVSRPFAFDDLIETPAMSQVLTDNRIVIDGDKDGDKFAKATVLRPGLHILSREYGQSLHSVAEEIVDIRESAGGLIDYYKIIPNLRFAKVVVNGEKPTITESDVRELLSRPEDTELWLEKLPPEVFSFCGFEVRRLVEVTSETSISRLRNLLLKREAVLSERRISQMEEVLRNYLRVPDLRIGLMALDYPLHRAVMHRYLIRQDLLNEEVDQILDPEFGDTIYLETCQHGTVRIYDDLQDPSLAGDALKEKLVGAGVQSLVLVPLLGKGDHVTGMLELGSGQPFAFSNLVLYQLEAIIPLFRQAVRRSRDEIEAQIQSVMRTNFTALDPSVEWRFVEAAAEIIEHEQGETEGTYTIPPIRFEDVWALYAQADIVSSSHLRNQAICVDLLAALAAAKTLLDEPAVALRYPLAGKLQFDIDELRRRLEDGMTPNDEQRVLEFLKYEFEPTREQLALMPEMAGRIEAYEDSLHAGGNGKVSRRDLYERSLKQVTHIVNRVINKRQVDAQRIIPHYFSKYRTDGVEFSIYAGQSLLRSGVFSEIHLQNLRLWQLQTMVDITKAVDGVQESLPLPMQTAQLVFAYGNAITIQFRMDEKRFDVEGAYNVRYEVIKKRIDKALIRGTEERLTLAGHVAIVYTHHTDRKIYLDLIKYLHENGSVIGEPEDLELEAMQGVDGMRAIRVRVV